MSQVKAGYDPGGNLVITIPPVDIPKNNNAIKSITGIDLNTIDPPQMPQANAVPFYTTAFNLSLSRYAQEFSGRKEVKDWNAHMSPELESAKNTYIQDAAEYNPENVNEKWKKYIDVLKTQPSFQNDEFMDYASWRANNPDTVIERHYTAYKGPNALNKDFEESGESDFEAFKAQRLEEKARDIYNSQKDLHKLKEYMTSEEENPFLAYNDVRKRWALQVADHYKDFIPYGDQYDNDQRVTLILGAPGAGKSSYIDSDSTDDNPVRNTKFGVLVDGDEFQKELIGYQGGAGSANALVYAISVVKPVIQRIALERGNDIVIPMVGGTSSTILNEIANNVINGHLVDVKLVPTDMATAHQRTLERAKQTGNRVISPYTTGDPNIAFKDAQNTINNPDYVNGDEFTKKILTKLGYTAAQIKKISEDDKKFLHDKYAAMVSFEVLA